jgi:hypothetical protein
LHVGYWAFARNNSVWLVASVLGREVMGNSVVRLRLSTHLLLPRTAHATRIPSKKTKKAINRTKRAIAASTRSSSRLFCRRSVTCDEDDIGAACGDLRGARVNATIVLRHMTKLALI